MAQVSPDLVILDIEMPEMDGLATLAELRKTYPRLPVIMFSSLTERGAEATLDALALGATDYFTKPTSAGGLEASLRVIREQLIPEIKALCASARRQAGATAVPCPTVAAPPSAAAAARAVAAPARRPAGPVQVLAIGASTGGPNALAEVFRPLAGGFSRADRDRAAHAADVHPAAGRTAVGPVRRSASRRAVRGAVLQTGARLDSARATIT